MAMIVALLCVSPLSATGRAEASNGGPTHVWKLVDIVDHPNNEGWELANANSDYWNYEHGKL